MTVSVFAQNTSDQNIKGSNGLISARKLHQYIEQGKTIHNHIINGKDLITIIAQTNKAIAIEDSIITGGLDFTALNQTTITTNNLPKFWSDTQKKQFLENKKRIFNKYYCVNNVIEIINCDIGNDNFHYRSISAERTFFFASICFQKSTFKGNTNWTDAVFAKDFLFQQTRFQNKASFVDAFFYGIVDFQEVFFEYHGAVFIKAQFYCKDVRFTQANFRFVSFRGVNFFGDADFSKTTYEKESYFTNVNFYKSADFSESSFSIAVFIRSLFHGRAFFKQVKINMASFQEVLFKTDVQFNKSVFTGTVFFNKAKFQGLADFSNVEFKSAQIQYKQVQFHGNALFSNVRFIGTVIFSNSLFTGDQLVFQGSRFLKSLYFVNAQIQSNDIDFHEIVVHGALNMQGTTFHGDTVFSESHFLQKADLSNTIFESEADFFNVTYQEKIIFSGTQFKNETEFSKNVFYDNCDLSNVRFHKLTDFSGSSFQGKADFTQTIFQSEAVLKNILFRKEANFDSAVFHDQVNFFESKFHELAYFKRSQFYGKLQLKNARFNGYVDFRNCLIKQLDMYSQKSPTIVKNRVDFRNAWIGAAHFQDIVFEDDVDFSGVIFGENDEKNLQQTNSVVLRYVTYEADVSFIRSVFSCNLSFEMITGKGFMNFRDAEFKNIKKIMMSYLNLSSIYIEWSQLPSISKWVRNEQDRIYSFADRQFINKTNQTPDIDISIEPISEVLQMFEEKFQNRLADKNDVIYLKQCIELDEVRQSSGLSFNRLQQELEWYFWGVFTGYTTKIWWITGWCIYFHLVFTSLYWWGGTFSRTHAAMEGDYDHTFKQRLFDLPQLFITEKKVLQIKRMHVGQLLNALRFSSVILFKIGYRDTTISGKIFGIDYIVIVWIEWLLGFFLLSCMAVTLSNTMPLVNRLITGVL
ncbi:MAG: hypothetical protein OMM_06181 [Candidatus Magnetoglobus multicellularis str. Araruama]|uniref:Pentapeptide repeat-containing protein n=1 Tax=Candidatus Magnetoglobus multicellularis str. Araruama TaxID=890399 RepID=A0A1V1PIU4_9BACT|nr:MAG: hypothetical protein OMM_06181 [Candidatus Magnetoglobus multicellularis str. Araruama]